MNNDALEILVVMVIAVISFAFGMVMGNGMAESRAIKSGAAHYELKSPTNTATILIWHTTNSNQ